MPAAHNTHILTQSNNTTRQQRRFTRVMTFCPLPLYLDHIFMYFYFLGSPTGDSQNGVSGVDFTEHGFLSDRGCSQPIFHGWSKQEPSERGSRDRCSLEDSKIHKKQNPTDNGPHLSCEQRLGWITECINQFIVNHGFQGYHLFFHTTTVPAVYPYFHFSIFIFFMFISRKNYLYLLSVALTI